MQKYSTESVFTKCIVFWSLSLFITSSYADNPDCDTKNMTCCFKNEEVKCWSEIAACANNTCESALRPEYYCRIKVAIHIDVHCGCKDGFFRNAAGICITRQQCIEELNHPPKIPDNPKCKGKHMVLVGFLHPEDYRVCPSRSSSTSSSSSSTSCSSSSSFSRRHRYQSENSQFLSFIKLHQHSSLYLMNVCNCVPPYYRNRCGKCVEYCECHKKCHGIHCPGPNEEERDGKCVCRKHYRRNKCGQCVEKKQLGNCCLCSNPCPGPNMMFRKFNDGTKRTCENLQNPPIQDQLKDQYGCDCMEGFNSLTNGTCVKLSECD